MQRIDSGFKFPIFTTVIRPYKRIRITTVLASVTLRCRQFSCLGLSFLSLLYCLVLSWGTQRLFSVK